MLTISKTINTGSRFAVLRGNRPSLLQSMITVSVCLITALLVTAVMNTKSPEPGAALALILLLLLAILLLRWPVMGLYSVAACAVLVEQGSLDIPIGTDRLTIYNWPPQLEGLIERPIGLLFLATLAVSMGYCFRRRQKLLQGGPLLLPLLSILLCVALAIVQGLLHAGSLKIIVVEVRPFWYLFLAYLVAYNLVTHLRHVYVFFWIVLVGAGIKALQGIYIYAIVLHGDLSTHHSIMSHEESFFFAAALLLLALFLFCYRYRPQFYVLLLSTPCIVVALFANQRRTNYVALLVALLVSWILVFSVRPSARKALIIGMVICILAVGGYVALFSQLTGPFSVPARSVKSIFIPDASDTTSADSNAYRRYENYDLKYTALQNPLLGWGFGREFLQPMVLQNISALDANYLYIPHNTIYWVWMRQGAVGYFALWYLFGTIIIRGCIIARQLKHPYLRLIAIYSVAVTFIEILVAYADYQLFSFRNVIYLGLLAGILMRLPALERGREVSVHARIDAFC